MLPRKKIWSYQFNIVYDYYCSVAASKTCKPTNRGFCDFLNVSTGKLQKWRHGQWPSAEDLEALHDKFGFSYRWLITGSGDPFADDVLGASSEQGHLEEQQEVHACLLELQAPKELSFSEETMEAEQNIPQFERKEKLCQWLYDNGMTYSSLSRQMGVTPHGVSSMLARNSIPTLRHRQLLALGVPEELLPPGKDIRTGPKPRPRQIGSAPAEA